MNKEEVKEALISGHKASSVLNSLILELIDDTFCLNSYGFEGGETFPDCGYCVVCVSKQISKEIELI